MILYEFDYECEKIWQKSLVRINFHWPWATGPLLKSMTAICETVSDNEYYQSVWCLSHHLLTDKIKTMTRPRHYRLSDCPVPVKTDAGQVGSCITVVQRDKWKGQIPKRAGTTDKSISTGIKYWVCCIKEPCLISNLSIIYFD